MDIILIRHGKKVPILPDKDAPLAEEGLEQVDHLKEQMVSLEIKPEVYLTSKYKRARQTAERLAPDSSVVHPLDALTPESNTFNADALQILTAMRDELNSKGIDLSQLAVVAIVGHEPQLSRLLAYISSKSAIETGTGIQVKASSFSTILDGEGMFWERIVKKQI